RPPRPLVAAVNAPAAPAAPAAARNWRRLRGIIVLSSCVDRQPSPSYRCIPARVSRTLALVAPTVDGELRWGQLVQGQPELPPGSVRRVHERHSVGPGYAPKGKFLPSGPEFLTHFGRSHVLSREDTCSRASFCLLLPKRRQLFIT